MSAPAKKPPPKKSVRHKPSASHVHGLGLAVLEVLINWKKQIGAFVLVVFFILAGIFLHYYVRFSQMIDARLSGSVFDNPSLVFSAPIEISPGDALTPDQVVVRLRRALYAEGKLRNPAIGAFQMTGSRLEVEPGTASFLHDGPDRQDSVALDFGSGRLASITDLANGQPLTHYLLEPELITTLFGQNRAKRRVVGYDELPEDLRDSILAAEDRRFFSHFGVNIYRVFAAAVADIRADSRVQGASTLTMQLARNFFLSPRRTFKRKTEEVMLALMMEQRLSKKQIFELYANQVYLGQRGSFSVYGFGEAADAYFNKDVKDLTLPEAALLAGIIRGPNLYSPYKYPRRATDRRNTVLRLMVEDKYITPAQAAEAEAAPLGVTARNVGGSQAPYFVDLVKDQLSTQFSSQDLLSQSYRIYTTLDPALQRAASAGVLEGIGEVDKELKGRRPAKGLPPPGPDEPQVALVALDPHTGQVRALVGGRNYAVSQLDHAMARRQPGSTFKPFVYATALSSGVDGSQPVITPATVLQDVPTTFQFGNQTYEPKDYKDEYYGLVTVREALALSLNVATVNLAQLTGYDKIRNLAIRAGFSPQVEATPAIALGAYETSPLDLAGSYTIFDNNGDYVAPQLILAVKDSSGRVLYQGQRVTRQVIDTRVAYLLDSLLETVIDHGTGEGARARGFIAPAAGKTGTSHDGWFAGFTSNLVCVTWVGYDDNRQLTLSGARSALPVWTAFMKQAIQLPEYHDVQPFAPPLGVITAPVDPQALAQVTGNPFASPDEVYIDGTQPESGSFGAKLAGIFRKVFPIKGPAAKNQTASPAAARSATGAAPAADGRDSSGSVDSSTGMAQTTPQAAKGPANKSQGGVLKKFFSIFKRKKAKQQNPPPANDPNP
ncbi:MAG TPA: PBP1A family penicillin-binding protein [Terriglobia bacterium]|nr:PBP1A family penicillin-binding protein [Terriglobia bacterium]